MPALNATGLEVDRSASLEGVETMLTSERGRDRGIPSSVFVESRQGWVQYIPVHGKNSRASNCGPCK